ncbi:MAG TPA: hypothetical protein VGC17_02475 [Lactovum miscens]|uniref:hypothetical protein n=1 Tax=Lactovum miscens TaxID=190387 RepID=UPI002ED841EE
MESQHRKVTYRMKNRGMYWSKNGAETMSQMILQNHEGRLRNLFFGPWKEEFQLIKDLSKVRHLIKKRGTVSSIASANLLRSGILKGEVVK